jgi:hypothetical protein
MRKQSNDGGDKSRSGVLEDVHPLSETQPQRRRRRNTLTSPSSTPISCQG